MRKVAVATGAVVVVLVMLALLRAARLDNPQLPSVPPAPAPLAGETLAAQLAAAITFPTLSQRDDGASAAPFRALHAWLDRTYPRSASTLSDTWVDAGRLRTWTGSHPHLPPLVLAAHLDVVPVSPDAVTLWTQPPFAGVVTDGYVWGRGALDDKASAIAMLAAIEALIAQGYRPLRTVHVALGHDEEIGGAGGAAQMAAYLGRTGPPPYLVLDEGMLVTYGIVPGVTAAVALVGVAEKGYLSLRLTATAAGGHSSMPASPSAIGLMAAALRRIEAQPFAARLHGPAAEMARWLAPSQGWGARLVAANMDILEPLLLPLLGASPAGNAWVRTTTALTMFHAGVQDNVLPSHAEAVVNLRIRPGQSAAEVMAEVQRRIADPRIAVEVTGTVIEPSPISPTSGRAFAQLQRSIAETFPGALVAPGLVIAATDARHYATISRHVYRFLPLVVTAADLQRFHGIDERIAVSDLERAATFYTRLILNTTQ